MKLFSEQYHRRLLQKAIFIIDNEIVLLEKSNMTINYDIKHSFLPAPNIITDNRSENKDKIKVNYLWSSTATSEEENCGLVDPIQWTHIRIIGN